MNIKCSDPNINKIPSVIFANTKCGNGLNKDICGYPLKHIQKLVTRQCMHERVCILVYMHVCGVLVYIYVCVCIGIYACVYVCVCEY